MKIITQIKNLLRPFYTPIIQVYKKYREYQYNKKETVRLTTIPHTERQKVFYLGITAHSNLGDMAQYYCIRKWLYENFLNADIYEFEAPVVVDTRFGFIEKLKGLLNKKDIIVFQSGYTTQDLGGVHDLMHRMVIDAIPNANILMMPQTIFFKHEKNKQRTAKSYNKAHNMLFLARDNISYEMATEMFPNIKVLAFPDIVTTLIGHFNYQHARKGVLICRRNDSEKFYSDEELFSLKERIEDFEPVTIGDTQIHVSYKELRANPRFFIENIIEDYSQYKAIITDRYHGTIFSLAANTPVIVIKTTDHKVITGLNWFKNIYDDYAFRADSLDEAYTILMKILNTDYDYNLKPYFEEHYYNNLKELFENTIAND